MFGCAQFVSIATWLWGTRAYSHSLPKGTRNAYEIRRSKRVDWYIFSWFLVLVAGHIWVHWERTHAPGRLVIGLGIWRIVDIVQANVNMHMFDGVRIRLRRHRVSSLLRSTLIAVWNYVEIIGWFALFYVRTGHVKAGRDVASVFDSVYFSTITQLTIGFGDVTPTDTDAKLLAMGQGLLGTLFLVFAISRFASLLPNVGQHASRRSRH